MKRKEILERLLEQARQGVFETSGNYLMTFPRKGYEREWSEFKETVEMLEELLTWESESGVAK